MKKFYIFKAICAILLAFTSLTASADGNGSLGKIFDRTKCGLDYTSASQRLGQRFSPAGVAQPAPFVISGMPPCAVIERAYLWTEGSGSGAAQTATISGPNGTANYPMSLVGSAGDKCWSYHGSYTYRADVTASVTTNGTYNISGLLTSNVTSGEDMDGATLMVIYSDPSASWQGNIVIADGAIVSTGGTANSSLTYTAVCGATSAARAFVVIGDLQMAGATITVNGTNAPYTWNWYNYLDVSTTVAVGQTVSNYTVNQPSDCYNYAVSGLYYRTTCATCSSPPTITLSTSSTPSTCTACNGTATATVLTGTPPFTYSWAPSGGTNATATGLCPGTYTVTVSNSCYNSTGTVTVTTSGGITVTSAGQTDASCYGVCDGTASVSVSGGTIPYTYSWVPSGGNGASASGLCAGSYTCNVSDANGCQGSRVFTIGQPAQLTAAMTPVANAVCSGAGTTINFTGTPNAVVTYNNGGPNQTITLSGAGTASISTGPLTVATTYTLVSVQLGSCSRSYNNSFTITINPNPVFNAGYPSATSPVCTGGTINFGVVTTPAGSSYAWTGPGFAITNTTQNPSITNAQLSAAGVYTVTVTTAALCSASANVTVVVNQSPAIALGTQANPTSCGGTQGSIIVTGMLANTAYTLGYTHGGPVTSSITSDASGAYTITGLAAGNYSSIYVVRNSCTSNILGPVVLTDPAPPVITLGGQAGPTSCGGAQGSITISGMVANAAYTLSYTNGSPIISAITADGAGTYTITGLAAGNYTNIYVVRNNCTSNVIGPVTLADPAPPVITPAGSVNPSTCGGSDGSFAISGMQANTNYTLSYTNGSPVVVAIVSDATGKYTVGGLSAGTYSNIYVVRNNCTSNIVGPAILSDPSPPVITGANVGSPVTCQGSEGYIQLTGMLPGQVVTVSYFDGFATHVLNTTADVYGFVMISGLSAGTYSNITVTSIQCTSAPVGPYTLTDPTSPVVTASSNSPVCEGQTLAFNSSVTINNSPYPPDSIKWVGPAFSTPATVMNPAVNNAIVAYSGTYTVTASVANCPSQPVTVSVVIHPSPALPNMYVSTPVCAGDSIFFEVTNPTAGDMYVWNGPGMATPDTAVNAFLANAQANASGVYTVSAFSPLGCAFNGTDPYATVTVNPRPNVPQVTDVIYCQLENAVTLVATPSGNPADTLKWYTQPTGGVPAYNSPTPATNAAGTFTWYVSQTNAYNCESARMPIHAVVKPKPTSPAIAVPQYTYCQHDAGASQLQAAGDSLQWYDQAIGGSGTDVAPTPGTDTPGTFVWYVSQTKDGCESERAAITVSVVPKPERPQTSNVAYCQYDTAAALTAIGTNLKWYTALTGGLPLAGPPTPPTTNEDSIVWYVSQTVNGCESDRAPLAVIIHYRPTVNILSDKTEICQYDSIVFNYQGTGRAGDNYMWSWPAGSVIRSGSGQGPINVVFNYTGTMEVSLQVSANNCYSPRIKKIITVKRVPVIELGLRNNIVCEGDPIYAYINWVDMEISHYAWNFGGGYDDTGHTAANGSEATGPYYIHWPYTGNYDVNLTVTGVDGCSANADAAHVEVHQKPSAEIIAAVTNNICAGDSVMLAARENNSTSQYKWSPDAFFRISNNSAVVYAYADYNAVVSLEITTEYGCKDTGYVELKTKPCCELYFPSAFSPNGDGKNDKFHILNAGRHKLHSLKVFNRFGQIVFETANETSGWDGSVYGVAQDVGVYYYLVKYICDGKDTMQKGEVTLVR